jgi:hypothetical protein
MPGACGVQHTVGERKCHQHKASGPGITSFDLAQAVSQRLEEALLLVRNPHIKATKHTRRRLSSRHSCGRARR